MGEGVGPAVLDSVDDIEFDRVLAGLDKSCDVPEIGRGEMADK